MELFVNRFINESHLTSYNLYVISHSMEKMGTVNIMLLGSLPKFRYIALPSEQG